MLLKIREYNVSLERREISSVSLPVAKVTYEALVLITFVLHGGHVKWSSRLVKENIN